MSECSDAPAIICVVGASRSGKTTLIESVLPLLRAHGLRIGVLKHTHHPLDLDRRGKDSWRHAQAGAEQVVLMGPAGLAYFDYRSGDPTPEDVAREHLKDVDLIIIEGYKWGPLPKIEVFRRGVSEQPMCLDDPRLLALITDDDVDCDAPTLSSADRDAVAALLVSASRAGAPQA